MPLTLTSPASSRPPTSIACSMSLLKTYAARPCGPWLATEIACSSEP